MNRAEMLKKATAAAVVAALVATSPGMAAAQAVGAEFQAGAGKAAQINVGLPVTVTAPLGGPVMGLTGSSIEGSIKIPVAGPRALATTALGGGVLSAASESPEQAKAAPAQHGAESAEVLAVPAEVEAVEPAAKSGLARSFGRLLSAASSVRALFKPAASQTALKGDAGKNFDHSRAFSGTAAGPDQNAAGAVLAPAAGSLHNSGLSKAASRGPPGVNEPPAAGGSGSSSPKSPQSPRRISKWLVAGGVAVLALGAFAALNPALAVLALNAVGIDAGYAWFMLKVIYVNQGAVHAALAVLSNAGYYLANAMGFVFPLMQVRAVFQNRSANISGIKLVAGAVASALLAFNMAYSQVAFAALQNLFGALSFGVILAQKWWYTRHPAAPGSPAPKGWSVGIKTALSIAAAGALTAAIGAGMLASAPLLPVAGTLLIAFQVIAGLGFAYLMLPELLKIEKEKSVGDASKGMAWSFWFATLGVGVWALHQLIQMPLAPAAYNLMPLMLYTAGLLPIAFLVVKWISRAHEWTWLPEQLKLGKWTLGREKLVNMASFLALSAAILVAFIGGYLVLTQFLPIMDATKFGMFLFYLVENAVALIVTTLTLKAFKRHSGGPNKGGEGPLVPAASAKAGQPQDHSEAAAQPNIQEPAVVEPAAPVPMVPAELADPPPRAEQAQAQRPAAPESLREPSEALERQEAPLKSADLSGVSLLRAKAAAQIRARRLAKDARLVKVTINLNDPRAHWTFVFHSDAKKKILTVWTKRIGVARLPASAPKIQTLWNTRLALVPNLETALAALKARDAAFVPARLEIRPQTNKDPVLAFADAQRRWLLLPARLGPVAAPAPEPAKPEPTAPQLPQPPPPAPPTTPTPPSPEAPKPPETPSQPEKAVKYLYEDFFGFRKVQGLKRDATLGALPFNATTEEIISRISRQFGIERAKVLSMAADYRLLETSPREKWLAVYDRLQKANRESFKMLDHKKYRGWSSFRELANRSYAEGWKGTLQRALEFHKIVMGSFRFVYHLFDMFLFGYFRQNISFEFLHSTEDFLSLKKAGDAEKWFKAALRERAFKPSVLGDLRAKPAFRALDRYVITPLLSPLGNFMVRRVSLAIWSALALGVVSAFAPGVAFMSFSLLSLPVLGPALVYVAHGLPFLVSFLPGVGDVLASAVGAALNSLLNELVVGRLVNTFVLSTFLTFPQAVKEKLHALREENPTLPVSLFSREGLWAVVSALGSKTFWGQNLKSFLGLVTVNAEIAGILNLFGGVDASVSRGLETVFGRVFTFTVFHDLASAVESPKGESVIPFGGAITWGTTLVNQAQQMMGFNLADVSMHAVVGLKGVVSDAPTDAKMAGLSAHEVLEATTSRPDQVKYEFDPSLYKKSPAEVSARIKELAATAGNLQKEIAAVKEHRSQLLKELGETEAKIAQLKKESRPVSREERAEYDRLLAELEGKRSEQYVKSKLSELHDLKNPKAEDLARLRQIKKLQEYYDAILLPPTENPGLHDNLASREADLKALYEHLTAVAEGRSVRHGEGEGGRIDDKTIGAITDLVKAVEGLREEARAEMTNRDALRQLIGVENKARNGALRERRNGKDMLDFHKNLSRLATVMDLALSLNEIGAAQAAIRQMQDALNAKLAKINASRAQNQRDQAAANANAQQIAQWQQEAQAEIDNDHKTAAEVASYAAQTGMAAQRIGAFKTEVGGWLEDFNAREGGVSGNAATEQQRRIDHLPTVAEWRTNGNPNDPDAFSLKKFDDILTEVNRSISQVEDGISQLPGVGQEAALAVILRVPGPEVNAGHNPTPETIIRILNERKVHWDAEKAKYQEAFDTVNRMMSPSGTGNVTDEFGDRHPESLPVWRGLEAGKSSLAQGKALAYIGQLNSLSVQINGATGSNIPQLSSNLDDLQNELKAYGDALRAVKIPDNDSDSSHLAKMNLITIVKFLPFTVENVIQWALSEGTIKEIDKAMTETLPVAQAKLGAIMTMMADIQADINVDIAYVGGSGEGRQQVMDRKLALLQNKILPPLLGARELVRDTLMPYQRRSIATLSASGDLFKLFDAKKDLVTQISDIYNKTMPWGLASFGGPEGDKGAGQANTAAFIAKLNKNLAGYDEAGEHHKGINEYLIEIGQRVDPDFNGTETLYGEVQPFSLPKKITQYTAERTSRIGQINTQAVAINEILGRIEAASQGTATPYDLSAHRLPTNLTPDAAGVAAVQSMVDTRKIQDLTDRIKAITDAAQGAGGAISLGDPNSNTPPTGTQPPITLNSQQQIALLGLEAIKRIVPTSLSQPESAPFGYAVARCLYSDGVVSGAQDALDHQIPVAREFLNAGKAALEDAIARVQQHFNPYIASGGTSVGAAQIYDQDVAIFAGLNAFLVQGAPFFTAKLGWDQTTLNNIGKVDTYYSSLNDIYSGGQTANDGEVTAIQTMQTALQDTFNDLEATRVKVSGWMTQLNDPHESALRRVNESMAGIQEKTRAVLEENIKYQDLKHQLDRSDTILRARLTQIEEKQQDLRALLKDAAGKEGLPESLMGRIDDLRLFRSSWSDARGQKNAQTLVIKKSDYGAFLDILMGQITARNPTQDITQLKNELLSNPQGLTNIIPESQLINFGDNADGFYLVYQTQFAVPRGLETGSWVTLGNIAQVWGNNVSLTGYQFGSPPNQNNAPYGDKGVEVQIESLQGDNWVNYLNIDFHRFALDIPPDTKTSSGFRQSRLMIFEDYAVMVFGDRLYIGVTGFADAAIYDAADKPYYYGGNAKASLKLTEVMSLNAEQQELVAKDPRRFLQQVNLDFTGYDPDLNHTYNIAASGENKRYSRTQIGPNFNIKNLLDSLDPGTQHETFSVDLFYARSGGTDDIRQNSLGASVLKGFTLKDSSGKPWMVINNRTTGELGQEYNTLTDKLSVTLPNQGIVISGEGKILGDARTYYGEISKKMGANTSVSVGYGSPYVGLNDRLSITMNTQFTLGELWNAVTKSASEELKGGEYLKSYQESLDKFYQGQQRTVNVREVMRAFEQDVAGKLITQDFGALTKEVTELRNAGAILDNTKIKGMVGFVTKPVSNDLAERATGGGFVAGSSIEYSMTKTQAALIESKVPRLLRLGLQLRDHKLETIKKLQTLGRDLAQASWELRMAQSIALHAPSDLVRKEGAVKTAEATKNFHQALLSYNAFTGRNPADPNPFTSMTPADVEAMLAETQKLMAAPDGLLTILHSLDEDQLRAKIGENSFNPMDWIPWIDRFTVNVGMQLQDLMSGQVFVVGGSVRLPIYNPTADRDQSYILDSKATMAEIAQIYANERLVMARQIEEGRAWGAVTQAVAPNMRAAADNLSDAIRAYRNGLIPQSQLRAAYADWHWYVGSTLEAKSRAALSDAMVSVDRSFVPPLDPQAAPVRITTLEDAFGVIKQKSRALDELALREQSAQAMMRANDTRIQKAFLDLHIGIGLTATGEGWIPSLSAAGIPVTPILGFELKPEELRELQVKQDQGQTEYYRQLHAKVESGLALQFFQNVVALRTAEQSVALIDARGIPELEAALAAARSSRDPSATQTAALDAARRLDETKVRREQLLLVAAQARATLNYLMGRAAGSALDIGMSLDEGLAGLGKVMAASDPAGTERRILESRVDVSKAVEQMVDKNLKIEQLYLEPISLTVRSLGRLIEALSGSDGNPDLVAAARVQTLTDERARDGYDKNRQTQIAQIRSALAVALNETKRVSAAADAESELARIALKGRVYALKAQLAALGVEPEGRPDGSSHEPMPASFSELRNRLAEKQQLLTTRAPESPLNMYSPETQTHQAAGFVRYYRAFTTLGREPLNQDFMESWVEVRLKSQNTPPEALIELANLRKDLADQRYRNELEGASAKADILASRFEADVMALRWAKEFIAQPNGAEFARHLTEFIRVQSLKLTIERDEIAALLDLDPNVTVSQLMELVPNDPQGTKDLRSIGDQLIAQIRARQIDRIKATLFNGGLKIAGTNDEDIINQLRANNIAEKMSFKGFTPMIAFGLFRGTPIGALALEAPDPVQIQKGLENVLSDVLRQELKSSGKLQELSLKLHLQMARVQDGAKLLEKRGDVIAAAEAAYRAQIALARDPAAPEVVAAQERLVSAWMEFAQTMVETKNDFITLVTELKAIGEGKGALSRPAYRMSAEEDIGPLRKQPTEELLAYWSERLLSPGFEAAQDDLLGQLPGVTGAMRTSLQKRVAAYRQAAEDADNVRHSDFSAQERLRLLMRADVEGRRQAVEAELLPILRSVGRLDSSLVKFFQDDLKGQMATHKERRLGLEATAEAVRAAFWESLREQGQAPYAAEGAFARLVALDQKVSGARQSLLESYLIDLDESPERFVLKKVQLDEYLKVEQEFDAELLKTLDSKEVRGNQRLALMLDGLFDVRQTFARSIDGARSGRGMLAIDALIMLEETRLAGARYGMRSPEEVARVAQALQRLKLMKQRWASGDADLEPLYVVTRIGEGGRRLWTFQDGWLTRKDFKEKKDNGLIEVTPQGVFLKADPKNGLPRREIIGGVDLDEAARAAAGGAVASNGELVGLHEKMRTHDFVALGAGAQAGKEGYSFEEVFGPQGLSVKGRVFFFDAPKSADRPGLLHYAVHPLKAFRASPESSALYVYMGDKALSRDKFPTLESLLASPDAADFLRLEMGPKGAAVMAEKSREWRAGQQRQGWVEMKLNGHGFAVDRNGTVADLYTTEDDFNAVIKSFQRAERDLASAREELARAQKEEAESGASADKAREKSEEAALKYQKLQLKLTAEASKGISGKFPRLSGEAPAAYRARLDIEVKKIVTQSGEFKAAQKEFESLARPFTEAAKHHQEMQAKAINAQAAVKAQEATLAHSKEWSLYTAKDLALSLDSQGALIGASAAPVYGSRGLNETIGASVPATRVVRGDVSAFAVDTQGRIVKVFQTAADVDRAAENWTIKSLAVGGDEDAADAKGTTVKTTYRLSHYEDKQSGLPIMLNRRYLLTRIDDQKSEYRATKHWGVMPWRWGSLLLELPRGIVHSPLELITGYDARQQHYLGRAIMYKTEGGATDHHGFFRKALGVIDILDLLPDPVERYFDPSQFPATVTVGSKILPGQDIFSKDMRSGDKDIHMGAKSIDRMMNHTIEDLSNGRLQTLGHFQGGVQRTFIETKRGRAGLYGESSREGVLGREAVDEAIGDPLIGDNPGSDGSAEIVLRATPNSIDVDRVEARLRIHPGLKQYDDQAAALEGYPARLAAQAEAARGKTEELKTTLAAAEAALAASLGDRETLGVQERELWDKVHALAWRIGAQEALEAHIARLEARAGELRGRLKFWEDYLKRLQDELRRRPDPTRPDRESHNFWAWLLMVLGLAALAAAVLDWWRGRRRKD